MYSVSHCTALADVQNTSAQTKWNLVSWRRQFSQLPLHSYLFCLLQRTSQPCRRRCLEEISRFIVCQKYTDRIWGPPSLLFCEYRGCFPRQVNRPLREAVPCTEVQNNYRCTTTPYAFKACTVSTLHASVTFGFSRTAVKYCNSLIIIVHIFSMLLHF